MSAGKAQRIDHILPSVGELLSECRLCGHGCGVDRLHDATGLCRTDDVDAQHVRVSSHTLHFGEEPMLVGRGGSGAVFFSHCNLRCVFCQNYQISQEGAGREVAYGELARMFQALQVEGAENINLVTPTHYIYPILLGLRHAYRHGLDRPLVYNTNGYDSVELLALLEGVVDLYLPDLKYMDSARAKRYSSAERYPDVAKDAIAEMFRQVGGVVIQNGVARKGVIIRHLVLPNDLANTY
ncbi:MAG: radical SAM protein, partial [Nitrospiraceae bacterium]|nr:radical SAM protein [Nitrospiraceae bacterium]